MKKIEKKNRNYLLSFEQYIEIVGYRKKSQERYLSSIKRFTKWVNKDLKAVNLQEVQAYQKHLEQRPNERQGGGLKNSTIRSYLSPLVVFYNYLQQYEGLTINPTTVYQVPPEIPTEKVILHRLEIQQLYQACQQLKEHCTLHLYYGLGLRRSEGAAVQLADIDYQNGWLYVPKGKGGKGRKLPLTTRIATDFKHYVLHERQSNKQPYFLLNQSGNPLRGKSALNHLKQLLKRANINKPVHLHSLRHSIATHLIQAGLPLEQVSDYLGHGHLESTQRYVQQSSTKSLLTSQLQK